MYTETPFFAGNGTTDSNYNDSVGDIFSNDVLMPVELYAVGAIIITAMVVTTAPIISLITSALDRTTLTTQVAVTIPTGAAVGNTYMNRISSHVALVPGQLFKVRITTQGVGSAGKFRPFVLGRYKPTADGAISTLTIVTA